MHILHKYEMQIFTILVHSRTFHDYSDEIIENIEVFLEVHKYLATFTLWLQHRFSVT